MNLKDIRKALLGLTQEQLEGLNEDEHRAIADKLNEIGYSKMYLYEPYEFQRNMFKAGLDNRCRFACLANRIGKTYSASQELAYHLTGLYPSLSTHGWEWEGLRYESPILAWAIGITSDSTRTVLQKELLGTAMARAEIEIGTGTLPRASIDFGTMTRDGNTVKSLKIQHVSGGYSTLEFRSTQQGLQALMGQAVDFILLDEEDPHNSLEIFSQCLTRTATRPKGRVLITATPENGYTDLIRKFTEEENLYIFHAGWDDAPHLTEGVKKELLSGIPDWEVPMRTQGIPSKGSGAIFPIDDSDIEIEEIVPKPHWRVLAAVDFGKSRDPSVIMFITKDEESGRYICYKEVYLDQDRSVENIAKHLLEQEAVNIPVIVPHDGNSVVEGLGNATRATIMRELGCNVIQGTFSNPAFIQNSITNVHKKNMGKEGGLHWMAYNFKTGLIKVARSCSNFYRQKRGYFWVETRGSTKPKDGDDDTIDALRYGLLSVDQYGVPYGQCLSQYQDFNNGYNSPTSGHSFNY